jgi:ACS family allantoate permease-like MFS transporter
MDPEKETAREDIDDSQVFEGDEALRLVGTEAQKFSEDYNRRLRNKLVRPLSGILMYRVY